MKLILALAFALAILLGTAVDWSRQLWPAAVAMTALTVVACLWAFFARDIRWPRQLVLVAPIAAWATVQVILHTSAVPYRTEHDAAIWAMCAVCFFLGAQILVDRESTRVFLTALLWGTTVLAAYAVLQFYSDPRHFLWLFPVDIHTVGTFNYKNQLAAFMELMAPIALWRVLYGNPITGGICYGVMLAATLTANSRTGLVLMGVELVVFLLMLIFRRRSESQASLRIGILVAVAVSAAIVAGTHQTTDRIQQQDPLGDIRVPINASSLKMIAARPLFGFGMGTWPGVYPGFATYDTGLFVNQGHDDWLQWAAEGGIPFALLMAGLTLWIAKPAYDSVWGVGLLFVMVHSAADFLLREPIISFAWFGIAGGVCVSSKVFAAAKSTAGE